MEVFENLPRFYEALKFSQKRWFLQENDYFKEKYNMSMNDQHLIDEIKASPPTAKPISNIPWYNVLANEVYQRDFNYFPSSLPDRSDYIVDDDSDDENDIE